MTAIYTAFPVDTKKKTKPKPSLSASNIHAHMSCTAIVEDNIRLSPRIRKLRIRCQEKKCECAPGQYISLVVHIEGQDQERFFYPIVDPGCPGCFDFLIEADESMGQVCNFLHALQPGASVRMRGPMGGFSFDAASHQRLLLCLFETGVAAGLSILRALVNDTSVRQKLSKDCITVIYGAKSKDDLVMMGELQDLVRQLNGRLIVDSAEMSADRLKTMKLPMADTPGLATLISGPRTFMTQMQESLHDLGYEASQIYSYRQDIPT